MDTRGIPCRQAESSRCPRERPIIFNAQMVRAILSGHKIQTRRPVGIGRRGASSRAEDLHCPYGTAGDILWVRETWCEIVSDGRTRYSYRADAPDGAGPAGVVSWRPSIHMPRGASRLRLLVRDTRLARLQDMTRADALAEGVGAGEESCPGGGEGGALLRFMNLWDGIYAGRGLGWQENPRVWVVAFERIPKEGGPHPQL